MTTLENKLNDECLKARKEKDSLKANLLLTIKGQVQNAQKGPNASSIDEIINAAAKSILKGLETVTQTDDTKREKEIVEEYLPQFMKEWEVIDYVARMEFASSNLGACIGQANKELAGKADGKIISLVVKNFLSSKSI